MIPNDHSSTPKMPSLPSKRLYIRGIAKDVIEDDLFNYFSSHGKVCEVKMLSSYTFVQFESEEVASLVLETHKKQPLLGNRVVIEFAHPLRKDMASISSNSSSPKPHSSYRSVNVRHPVVVLGLPRDIRWQELKDFGRMSGMLVAYCDLDKTEEGRGFIEFFTQEDAQRAIKILNGKRLGGRRIRVVDHEELRDFWDRTGRHAWNRRPQSPERRLSPNDYSQAVDRTLEISARRVYSPVPRVPKIASAYDYSKHHRYPETQSYAYHITSSIAYEEPYNWSYDVAKIVSPERAPYQYQDYDYSQLRLYDNMGAYDDGELGYDSRNKFQIQPRAFDPYQ